MYFYYPGRIWLDTDGKPIQAHGGGIPKSDVDAGFFALKSDKTLWPFGRGVVAIHSKITENHRKA
ncbi:hypothetical protein ACJX0J_005919, partial [Zea mays]